MTRNIGNFIGASSDNGGVFTSLAQQVLRKANTWGDIDILGGTPFIPGNGYRYHVFGSTGTLTVNSGGSVEVLLIAGGGGGGYSGEYTFGYGGGGGAGGFVSYTTNIAPGIYTVTVGGGGSGATPSNGSDSSISGPPQFTTITASGGGYGGWVFGPANDTGAFANSGGSGGGAGAFSVPNGTVSGAAGNTPIIPVALGGPQGNSGGPDGPPEFP